MLFRPTKLAYAILAIQSLRNVVPVTRSRNKAAENENVETQLKFWKRVQ